MTDHSFLHFPSNIVRIFLSNLTNQTVSLRLKSWMSEDDTIDVPIGFSSVCLCAKSYLGFPRVDNFYNGVSLGTNQSELLFKLTDIEKANENVACVLITYRLTPPKLSQLTTYYFRALVQNHNELNFDLLTAEIPQTLKRDICAPHVHLTSNTFKSNTFKRCKCGFSYNFKEHCFTKVCKHYEKGELRFKNNRYSERFVYKQDRFLW
jgi:hypothetical protein